MTDDRYPRYVAPASHELKAHFHFETDGLSPYFAFHSCLKQSDGRPQESTLEIGGETVDFELKRKGSNLAPRSDPNYQLETVPEYILSVEWPNDPDRVDCWNATSQISPRWPGIESKSRNPLSFSPDYVGLDILVQGSNLRLTIILFYCGAA